MAEGGPLIPVARPWMDEREGRAAQRAILSGWVTQGPEVEAFEREFAAYVGAPHARAVSSGTTALHLALLAVGVGAGHEVITVSHSHIATANSGRYCGATPVFVDVQPATYNIAPEGIEAAISERTRAILCVPTGRAMSSACPRDATSARSCSACSIAGSRRGGE